MRIRRKKNPDIHTKRQMQIRKHREKKIYQSSRNKIKKAVETQGAKTVCDQLDGGEELQQSAMLAGEILRPVTKVSEKGAALFKESVLEKKRKKYKVATPGEKKDKDLVSTKASRETRAREKNKVISKENAENPKGSIGSEKQGTKGKRSLRNRKIKAFLEKRKTKKQMDNPEDQNGNLFGSTAKVYGTRAALTIFGILGGIMSLIALVAVPVILIITLLYNSPLALFLPPLSEGDTVQIVAESYVQEFLAGAEREANEHLGYDEGEIYYQDPYGNMVLPIPQKDIICVYMVKYGTGDTAAIMNDKSRRRLLRVVEDMCRYSTTSRTEKRKDEKGKEYEVTILEVNVVLKDCRDMAVEYGFSEEQTKLLEMMMQR